VEAKNGRKKRCRIGCCEEEAGATVDVEKGRNRRWRVGVQAAAGLALAVVVANGVVLSTTRGGAVVFTETFLKVLSNSGAGKVWPRKSGFLVRFVTSGTAVVVITASVTEAVLGFFEDFSDRTVAGAGGDFVAVGVGTGVVVSVTC
jgi:hypothetical protein